MRSRGSFVYLRVRIQALHQWLRSLDREDHFDYNVSDDPFWTCFCFGCFNKARIERADKRIEMRRRQRDAIRTLEITTATVDQMKNVTSRDAQRIVEIFQSLDMYVLQSSSWCDTAFPGSWMLAVSAILTANLWS